VQFVARLVHVTALCLEIEQEIVASHDIRSLLDPDISTRPDFVGGFVIEQPIGVDGLPAPPQLHVPLNFRFLVTVSLEAVGFEKHGYALIGRRRGQDQRALHFQLEAGLGARGEGECAQDGEEHAFHFQLVPSNEGRKRSAKIAQFLVESNQLPALPDIRLEQLQQWLGTRFPAGSFALAPASADASFRRYFRVSVAGASWIVMDAPPEQEDCRSFVHVARLLRAAGVNAPEIVAQDLARGFLLLTDLGDTTYLSALNEGNANRLFGDAIDALLKWQLASRENELPPYDAALLQTECDLFAEWYVARHLQLTLSAAQRQLLADMVKLIISSNMAQPAVYVHRDYMPRNLMLTDPNPGVIDFQDAVYGPITYDLVSLTRDAFVSWEEQRVLDWTVRYWEKAKHLRLPVAADFAVFYRDFEWMGLQRHLKVLGIFARLHYRDRKAGYLEDTPRFMRYARAVAERYQELGPLARLLDELESREPAVRYSF